MTGTTSVVDLTADRTLLGEGAGSRSATPPPLLPRLAKITDLERQRDELADKRDKLLLRLLSDLEWMDVPVHRLNSLGVTDLPKETLRAGTRVHIVRQYEERGTFDMLISHPIEKCQSWCGGSVGATVKAGGATRWRFRCEGEFYFLGTIESEYEKYLFSAVTL